jgi:hypothetical protein
MNRVEELEVLEQVVLTRISFRRQHPLTAHHVRETAAACSLDTRLPESIC